MKKLLYIVLLCLLNLLVNAQYPVNQSIGSDSTLVTSKGGLKGRLVNFVFTDTTQANTQRIKQYAGAQIVTYKPSASDSGTIWLRNGSATKWLRGSGSIDVTSLTFFNDTTGIICFSNGVCDTFSFVNNIFPTVNNTFGCNSLVQPGYVTYSGTGIVFNVSNGIASINCKLYPFDSATVTGAIGGAQPRFDVIYVDTNGVIGILQGTEAANPVKPQVDPSSQLELSFYRVDAGATTPFGITLEVIYNEGIEWDTLQSNWTPTVPAIFLDAQHPYVGTKDILISTSGTPTSSSYLQFTRSDTLSTSTNWTFLKFFVSLNQAFSLSQGFSIQWALGSTLVTQPVTVLPGTFTFSATNTGAYQPVIIPFGNFIFDVGDTAFNRLYIYPINGAKGMYIDYITLQAGLDNNVTGNFILNQIGSAQPANWWIGGRFISEGGGSAPNTTYSQSERWGFAANVTGTAGTSLGYGANAGAFATGLGNFALSSGNGSVAIGAYTQATAANAVAIDGFALHTNSIAIQGVTTGFNQLVIGRTDVPIIDVYVGDGVTSATPDGVTWHSTAGSGTNTAGSTQTWIAQQGTGNDATSGAYIWQTGTATGSGTTLQTASNVSQLSKTGQWTFNNYTGSTFRVDDTTNYKPIVKDASGNIYSFAYWPGGDGGYFNPNQTSTGATSHDANYKDFAVSNLNSSEYTSGVQLSGNYTDLFFDSTLFNLQTHKGGIISAIIMRPDSIQLAPSLGKLNIDSLRVGASTDSVMTWDAVTGEVKYRNASSFGTVTGANNGLVLNSSRVIGLDSNFVNDLSRPVNIDQQTNLWTNTSSQSNTGLYAFNVQNSTGGGGIGATNAGLGNAISGSSTTGTGLAGSATSGNGLYATITGTGIAGRFRKTTSSTNTAIEINRIIAGTDGTAAAGLGGYIGLQIEDDGSSDRDAVRLGWVWTTVSGASSVADFVLSTANAGAATEKLRVTGNGRTILSGRLEMVQGADVASVAGAIAVGLDGNVFELTGTNAVTLISNLNFQNGSMITFVFTSTATLTDGTANSGTDIGMELAGNANFVGSADDVITLVLSEIGGVQRWREVSRSVN